MQRIKEVCDNQKVFSTVRKLTYGELTHTKFPQITLLRSDNHDILGRSHQGHFVVLLDADEDKVTMIDTSSTEFLPRTIPAQIFRQIYSQYTLVPNAQRSIILNNYAIAFVLVFVVIAAIYINRFILLRRSVLNVLVVLIVGCGHSGKENPVVSTGKIEVPITTMDLGMLNQSTTSNTAKFEIINRTNETQTLETGKTSCTCTTATVNPATIKPGEKATVSMTMKSDLEAGPRAATLAVTNKTGSWTEVFSIQGFVEGIALEDHYILAGDQSEFSIDGAVFQQTEKSAKIEISLEVVNLETARIKSIDKKIGPSKSVHSRSFVEIPFKFQVNIERVKSQLSTLDNVKLVARVRVGDVTDSRFVILTFR